MARLNMEGTGMAACTTLQDSARHVATQLEGYANVSSENYRVLSCVVPKEPRQPKRMKDDNGDWKPMGPPLKKKPPFAVVAFVNGVLDGNQGVLNTQFGEVSWSVRPHTRVPGQRNPGVATGANAIGLGGEASDEIQVIEEVPKRSRMDKPTPEKDGPRAGASGQPQGDAGQRPQATGPPQGGAGVRPHAGASGPQQDGPEDFHETAPARRKPVMPICMDAWWGRTDRPPLISKEMVGAVLKGKEGAKEMAECDEKWQVVNCSLWCLEDQQEHEDYWLTKFSYNITGDNDTDSLMSGMTKKTGLTKEQSVRKWKAKALKDGVRWLNKRLTYANELTMMASQLETCECEDFCAKRSQMDKERLQDNAESAHNRVEKLRACIEELRSLPFGE